MLKTKIKILLVEDEKSLGITLQERLNAEGYKTVWANTVKETKQIWENHKFDLIILDVGLPDGDGFELAKMISKSQNPPPFLFLTAVAGAQERLKGFELGAEEFIPKPFHLKELLLRVKHVLEIHKREEEKEISDIVQLGNYKILFHSYEVQYPNGKLIRLVPRDSHLLKYLITHRDRVVSRDEILDKLWGEDQFPSNRTIDNSIVRLRQIFGEEKEQVITSIRGVGYRWVGNINP